MSLPKVLEDCIQKALTAVRQHPNHVLNLGYRTAIWAMLGSFDRHSHPSTDAGHRRRTLLAIESARRVLPIWEQRWPEDCKPHDAIQAAIQLLHTQDNRAVFWDTLDRCAVGVENLMTTDFIKSMAGESAVLALNTALDDEYFKPGEIDYEWTDGQLGGGDNDGASVASIAYAGGTALDPKSDPEKRLEFWEWWLKEAVPASYQEGTLEKPNN